MHYERRLKKIPQSYQLFICIYHCHIRYTQIKSSCKDNHIFAIYKISSKKQLLVLLFLQNILIHGFCHSVILRKNQITSLSLFCCYQFPNAFCLILFASQVFNRSASTITSSTLQPPNDTIWQCLQVGTESITVLVNHQSHCL